jgi:hypothetical protein
MVGSVQLPFFFLGHSVPSVFDYLLKELKNLHRLTFIT